MVVWQLGLPRRCDGGCHDYDDADGDGGDLGSDDNIKFVLLE